MKTIIVNLTPEQGKKFKEHIEANREKFSKRAEEMLAKIPVVHFEILKYHNDHSKEETIAAYPEHREFIDTIR